MLGLSNWATPMLNIFTRKLYTSSTPTVLYYPGVFQIQSEESPGLLLGHQISQIQRKASKVHFPNFLWLIFNIFGKNFEIFLGNVFRAGKVILAISWSSIFLGWRDQPDTQVCSTSFQCDFFQYCY